MYLERRQFLIGQSCFRYDVPTKTIDAQVISSSATP